MTTPSPAEQIASEISSLQSRLGSLQDAVRLSRVRDTVEDLQTTVNSLPQRIAGMRTKGYAFEKDLEKTASDLNTQWIGLSPTILAQINQQSANLQAGIQPIQGQIAQAAAQGSNPSAARPILAGLTASITALEDQASAAERQLDGMYDTFSSQVSTLKYHLDEIDWMLTQISEAKFTLLPGESGIMAVKAIWCKDVKERDDDPEGVLYLTDQRLLFEQKQEIVTKKVLFIATEKQKVQELKWEVAVPLFEEAKTSKQGILKNEDHLDLRFGSGATLESAHLHIWQDCNRWTALLNRAKTKDFDQGRAIAIDQAAVEKIKSLPAQCPSCGGNINQVVLRGQDSVKCEFCGFVIRL